jgi:hypothetical protein
VNSPFVAWFQDHAVLLLSALAVLEGLMCAALLRGLRYSREALRSAESAAEDAARAAALAAPGAIDPEVVLTLLREGRAPTLDNLYAIMQRSEETKAAETPLASAGTPQPLR